MVSWNCKFNLKVLPSYYYFLFYQTTSSKMDWQSFIEFKTTLDRDVFYEFLHKSCYFCADSSKNMTTMWLWKFWLVDFQESLKGLNWNLVYMFLWMSLTCVVTVCAIWKFKMATSGGQICIETLWETTFSSSSWEQLNRI